MARDWVTEGLDRKLSGCRREGKDPTEAAEMETALVRSP
jgi:hypothetical protein